MFEHLNSVFQLMGRGLANQDFGEMTPTAEKIAQIEKWSHHYRLSGGQGRIVLIASTDPMGLAFDFVVELAKKTRSLIEILYLKPEAEVKTPLAALLSQLGDLPHDFQITFVAGNLLKTISDYSKQC